MKNYTLEEFELLKPAMLQKNEEIYLQIKTIELLKILKGEKTEEYRELSEFNCEKLLYSVMYPDKKPYGVGRPEIKTILFRAGMKKDTLFARIEVKMIRSEQFFKKIPEDFKQGDCAITIYLGDIIETNYKKD